MEEQGDATVRPGFSPEEVKQRLDLLPLPLEPESIGVRVMRCVCHNGRGQSTEGDPDDFGIPGCCGGHGVRLEVTPGLEPLVLRLAAIAAYGWADDHKQDSEAFSVELTYEIEREVGPALERWPPHEQGAQVARTWAGSEEQSLDVAIAEGRA